MTPLDVFIDLFGSDPIHLHGALIVDAVGLAQLVAIEIMNFVSADRQP